MKTNPQDPIPDTIRGDIPASKHLSGEQIEIIDDALAEVGESGVVRLLIEEGRLNRVVVQKQKEFDVDDYQPGVIKGAE